LPIRYFNRYTAKLETERIYGEAFLRWAYETPFGRLSVETLAKRACFSRWYGWRMSRPASRKKIVPFIKNYGVDVSEFFHSIEYFASFNDFFYRALKSDARPIHPEANTAIFPADGRHLGFQNLAKIDSVFVKGQGFDLLALLADKKLARNYENGTLVLSRLCPVDYHRFHFPVSGLPRHPRLINGHLYSVSPIALRRNLRFLIENKRMLTLLQSSDFGTVLLIEIGATNVGSIIQKFHPGQPVEKGAEKGLFQFGGSAVITLFEAGRITLAEDLLQYSEKGLELYARMGDLLGTKAP